MKIDKGTAAASVVMLTLLAPCPFLRAQQKPTIAPESTVPLIQALREGDLKEAQRLLRSGTNLNVTDNYGDTPLLQAIRNHYSAFAEELLSLGADPKYPDGSSSSLITAAWYCDLRIARKLVDLGVSVNGVDAQRESALMAASQTCQDGAVVKFLLDMGADPNLKSSHRSTALMWAAGGGNPIAVEKLLKAGADPTPRDEYGRTAMSEACGRSGKAQAEVCSLLQKATAPR